MGFICANMELVSTMRSSFRGILWLYTALSSFGASFTLNFVFITISILCLAKMSWQLTKIFSVACFSYSVSSVLVQSNRSRNFVRDSVLFFGFKFSFFFNSYSSLKIAVCIGVWSSIIPGFSGVGDQNVLVCCSGLFVLRSSSK